MRLKAATSDDPGVRKSQRTLEREMLKLVRENQPYHPIQLSPEMRTALNRLILDRKVRKVADVDGVGIVIAPRHPTPTGRRKAGEAKRKRYIEAARRKYQTDDVEIDDEAKLSVVDQPGEPIGAWVQAWVWVNAEEL